MFNEVVSFWSSIVGVFLNVNGSFPFYFYWNTDYGSGAGIASWTITVYPLELSRLLAGLSLLGLSVFLFYQIYKVIHAFIGGFYEDAI